ncbi:hypothetical protein, partial [Shewanella xiamenensis]|uniref:hypothetical protein n=1 Tax=Shewanella xiamenensis TaxID=332186 RepID=UPI0035BA15E0
LMSFSDYIVAHCEADLKWMGPFHYPCHRGIRESIHIRRAVEHPRTDLLRVGERMPWLIISQHLKNKMTKSDPSAVLFRNS